MLIQISEVFTSDEAAEIRARLEAAQWVDGKVAAGLQSAHKLRKIVNSLNSTLWRVN